MRAQYGKGASADVIKARLKEFWDTAFAAMSEDFAHEIRAGFRKQARNTPGYDRDFGRVLSNYATWTAHYIGDLEFRNRIESLRDNEIANHPDVNVRNYVNARLEDIFREPH